MGRLPRAAPNALVVPWNGPAPFVTAAVTPVGLGRSQTQTIRTRHTGLADVNFHPPKSRKCRLGARVVWGSRLGRLLRLRGRRRQGTGERGAELGDPGPDAARSVSILGEMGIGAADDGEVRFKGSKAVPERISETGTSASLSEVLSFAQDWRPRGDSNTRPTV